MKRKKVCHFASVHTISDTRVFQRECVTLAKHYDVTYIGIGNTVAEISNVRVIGIPKPKSRLRRLLFTTWKVFFKALKVNADIYHIHDAELIPFAFILSLLGKSVVYDIHENTYEDIIHKKWIPLSVRKIAGAYYRFLEWLSSVSMTTILVIAKPEFAQRFIKRKYAVVQNFADVNELKKFRVTSRNTLEGEHLFYIGTIFDFYYDLIPVVKAINMLRQDGKIIHLHLVGYVGSYIDKTLSKIPEYAAVRDQLHFYQHQTSQFGYEISKRCKVGLCLKNQPKEILVSHERKFFEYIATGLPVLCCDSHIYKEVVDEYKIGRYANLGKPESIAEAISRLVYEDNLDWMMHNCIHAAESSFNWDSQAEELLKCYANL